MRVSHGSHAGPSHMKQLSPHRFPQAGHLAEPRSTSYDSFENLGCVKESVLTRGGTDPRRSASLMASIRFREKGDAKGWRVVDFLGVFTDTSLADFMFAFRPRTSDAGLFLSLPQFLPQFSGITAKPRN